MKDSERNQKGKELEALGDINAAIEAYEQNVTILSPAPFPYKRLALIYKKNKDINNEIRVLKALLSIQENEAKKYKWVEGTKPFEKIQETRDKLQKALSKKKV
jgi:tetratricopeptide (TPR) repeat protein